MIEYTLGICISELWQENQMNIESETKRINEHADKGNYHAAINLAISAMNESRRENDQAGTDYFINMIKTIANTIGDEFGSKS